MLDRAVHYQESIVIGFYRNGLSSAIGGCGLPLASPVSNRNQAWLPNNSSPGIETGTIRTQLIEKLEMLMA